MNKFVARISNDNFNAIMSAFFQNIGVIDSSTVLYFDSVTIDDDSVELEAFQEEQSIQ